MSGKIDVVTRLIEAKKSHPNEKTSFSAYAAVVPHGLIDDAVDELIDHREKEKRSAILLVTARFQAAQLGRRLRAYSDYVYDPDGSNRFEKMAAEVQSLKAKLTEREGRDRQVRGLIESALNVVNCDPAEKEEQFAPLRRRLISTDPAKGRAD